MTRNTDWKLAGQTIGVIAVTCLLSAGLFYAMVDSLAPGPRPPIVFVATPVEGTRSNVTLTPVPHQYTNSTWAFGGNGTSAEIFVLVVQDPQSGSGTETPVAVWFNQSIPVFIPHWATDLCGCYSWNASVVLSVPSDGYAEEGLWLTINPAWSGQPVVATIGGPGIEGFTLGVNIE